MKRIYFYNLFNKGDIHLTREFIKDIIGKTKFDEYYYLHKHGSKLLRDIQNLKYEDVNEYCLEKNIYLKIDDDVYVNVHVGNAWLLGIDLEDIQMNSYYEFFKFIYDKLNIEIEKDKKYYIPTIDYNYYDIDGIKNYISNNYNNKILVSNGHIFSGQAPYYTDLNEITYKLSKDFKDIHFILTNEEFFNLSGIKWDSYNMVDFDSENIFNDVNESWAGHRSFAYDLIANIKPKSLVELGVYSGTSFFSFCKSVKDNNIDCRLYAVDSWIGDLHSGDGYSEDVYNIFNGVKNKFYPNINIEVLRMNFDDALDKFEDNSIDILHIDGYHTYDAIKHDFELWFSKVKSNGIILLHDIVEKRNDFGVYLYWDEIKEKYNTFDFIHSHGLGVVFKNPDVKLSELQKIIWKRHYFELFKKKYMKYNNLNVFPVERDISNQLNNVLLASDIIGCYNNLNEISYLSKFCNIIIGKCSGPYTYSQTKDTLNNPQKKFIFNCYNLNFGVISDNCVCDRVWITKDDDNFIYEKIKEEISKLNRLNFKDFDIWKTDDDKIYIKSNIIMDKQIKVNFIFQNSIKWTLLLENNFTHWVNPFWDYRANKDIVKLVFFIDNNNILFETFI